MTGRSRNDAGFTLLELLVGIVVLGFILAGLGGGVRLGIRALDTQARLVGRGGELDAADRLLRRLIETAEPGSDRVPASLAGTAHALTLTAPMPRGAGGGLGDVALGVDGRRRLVLRWTPHRHARPLGPAPTPQEAELVHDLATVEFAFWDGTAWRADWDAKVLPGLVRVRLVFPPADKRRWPDIVAAPTRASARS